MVTKIPCTMALPGSVTIPDDVIISANGSLELGLDGDVRDALLGLLMGLDEGSVPMVRHGHVDQRMALVVEGDLRIEADVDVPWDLDVEGDIHLAKASRVGGSVRCSGCLEMQRHAAIDGPVKATVVRLGPGARVRAELDVERVETE